MDEAVRAHVAALCILRALVSCQDPTCDCWVAAGQLLPARWAARRCQPALLACLCVPPALTRPDLLPYRLLRACRARFLQGRRHTHFAGSYLLANTQASRCPDRRVSVVRAASGPTKGQAQSRAAARGVQAMAA